MKIDLNACRGCGMCVKFCPMHAISIVNKKAVIDQVLCAECGVCARAAKCPFDAIVDDSTELTWPRTMRNILSNPLSVCVDTGISGRGTEEMKTNDVTHRFNDPNIVGIAMDIGRPNVGVCLRDVEKITRKLVPMNIQFEKCNPVSDFLADETTGKLKEDVLDEYLVSLVLEFSLPIARLPELIKALHEVEKEIDTVFSLGVISLVADDGTVPAMKVLDENNISYRPNGKVNLGLGHM